MNIDFANALAEVAEMDGFEMEIRDDYRGPGSEETTAVVCASWRDFAAAVARVVEERNGVFEAEDLVSQIRRLRQDSMGRDGVVIY